MWKDELRKIEKVRSKLKGDGMKQIIELKFLIGVSIILFPFLYLFFGFLTLPIFLFIIVIGIWFYRKIEYKEGEE